MVSGTPIQNRFSDFRHLCGMFNIQGISQEEYNDIILECVLKRTKKSVGMDIPDVIEEFVYISWENDNERQISNDFHKALRFLRKMPEIDDDSQSEEEREGVEKSEYNPIHEITSELYPSSISLIHTMRSRQMCVLPKLTSNLLKRMIPLLSLREDDETRIIENLLLGIKHGITKEFIK